MEITLRKEQKEKYKTMSMEEIIADIKTRNHCVAEKEIIDCAKWIMEESR